MLPLLNIARGTALAGEGDSQGALDWLAKSRSALDAQNNGRALCMSDLVLGELLLRLSSPESTGPYALFLDNVGIESRSAPDLLEQARLNFENVLAFSEAYAMPGLEAQALLALAYVAKPTCANDLAEDLLRRCRQLAMSVQRESPDTRLTNHQSEPRNKRAHE
jgi:hypothetical protein